MNHGAVVFLLAFLAISTSWYGFVVKPAMQVGRQLQTNVIGSSMAYPLARPGLAAIGRDVYRANGCAYCHSQQVAQERTIFQVMLTDAGTNLDSTVTAIRRLNSKLELASAQQLATSALPKLLATFEQRRFADDAVKAINATSAKAAIQVTPLGPDIARGWGKRRSVADDYLYDYPVMLGSQRIGPDLANVGARLPDVSWHLRHLYAPRSEINGSTMPSYPYLFEVRPIRGKASPNALQFSGQFAASAGREIVPTDQALALAAYLVSLRSDAALFSAPMNIASAAPPPDPNSNTNATSSTTTNVAPPGASAEPGQGNTNAPAAQ